MRVKFKIWFKFGLKIKKKSRADDVTTVGIRYFRAALQVLYINIVKVDLNVTHIIIAIHVCFKYMFKIFHLFQTNVINVLSECYKSISRCYIAYVSSILRCFIRILASVTSGYCICLQWFLNVFRVFSQVFHTCLFFSLRCNCYIWCFKSRSGVAHEIPVGSGRQRVTTAGALPHEPDALGAHSLLVRLASRHPIQTLASPL
jgi:hypothetical protein